MFSIKPVLFILGVILAIIGAFMLLPAIIDAHHKSDDWQIFITSSLITVFAGFFLILVNKEQKIKLNLKQAILLTPLTWFSVSLFAALPFYLCELGMNFAQAFFEAVSGLTTTGATVISGLENAPKGILLWRALLQYLGGLGIIAAALLILPALGIGGMQLFKNESFGTDQKHLPRTGEVAKSLFSIYTFMCIICAFCYYQAGMNGFDAITHSLYTLANGGFSNYDSSFAHFNSIPVEIIAMIFMLLSAMPYIIFFKILRGNVGAFWKDGQIKYFLATVAGFIIILTFWVDYNNLLKNSVDSPARSGTVEGIFAALRYVSFNVVSMIATCGFVTTDYSQWGSFAQLLFILAIVTGGCMGSTSGGLKIFRIRILFKIVQSLVKKLMSPHGVFRPQYEHKSLSEEVLNSVSGYFFVYVLLIFLGAILLSADGLDILTSISSSAAMVGNSGVGLGAVTGPGGSFSSLSDYSLYVGSMLMILGRLELLAVLVLLSRSFWRE